MRVKFWGVRGSIPAPLTTEQLQEKLSTALTSAQNVDLSDPAEVRAFIAGLPPAVNSVVGGNTTCVEITSGDDTIIIDCGTGLRSLGVSLMSHEFGRGQGTAHIFFTHAHWDHLQGFPFFSPAYVPGNKFIIYAINNDPRKYLEHQQLAPIYFPITTSQMPADFEFVQLREGERVQIGRLSVTSMALYHPGTAYAYRFDDGESVFVFASDGEYKSLDDEGLGRFIEFFSDAEALVFDCQFSLRDVLLSKADWGHSSAMIGVEIAQKARVKKLITTHYDPVDTDEQIHSVGESARRYADIMPGPVPLEVIVGTEGTELFLGPAINLETLEDREADIWLIAFAGKLTADTAIDAQITLYQFLREAPNHRAIIDLTLIAVIDGLGVRGLIAGVRGVRGAQVAFVAPGAVTRRNLEHSDAREVGPIFRKRSHAIAALVGPAHLNLHERMLGDYRLDKTIAADEFGAIYSALRNGDTLSIHNMSSVPLVIQVLGNEISPQQRIQFAHSAIEWCRLTHPRLVPGREVIEKTGGMIAYVGERPNGQTWSQWLVENGGRVSPQVGLRWLREMVDALDHAYRNNVVHGDLRPECFVFNNGHARISRSPLFSPTGELPSAYRAPEQLRGEPPTHLSDQFSLGVLLYEALVGSHPFHAETEELSIAQQLQGAPLAPRVFLPDLSADVEDFLMRLLSREPQERFPNADEILAAIDRLLLTLHK